MHKIAVLVGSLRRDSDNRKLAKALEKLGAEGFSFSYPDLDLPLYNEDLWRDPPKGVLALKDAVAQADAVLFVTPEYNRSISPAIKNAIDWGSRPRGENSWTGKPAATVGTSPGSIGTAVAQSHLRTILLSQDMKVMGQPELYLVFRPGLIEEDGAITNDDTRQFLAKYLTRFSSWIDGCSL